MVMQPARCSYCLSLYYDFWLFRRCQAFSLKVPKQTPKTLYQAQETIIEISKVRPSSGRERERMPDNNSSTPTEYVDSNQICSPCILRQQQNMWTVARFVAREFFDGNRIYGQWLDLFPVNSSTATEYVESGQICCPRILRQQ